MSASTLAPIVVSVAPGSPAALVGVRPGDEILRVNGDVPRDIIEWQLATDEAEIDLDVSRGGLDLSMSVEKVAGASLGIEVSSAVFDRVRTCDNHCEFCFIYQLPKGMRRSLYLKDDDYRLSFLYGNFTTLTRFTEADLERVVTERLSPLHVSIHATNPDIRSAMLKNPRGGMSLRWLRALLDHDIAVKGQIVVCPGVNDGAVLDDTLAGVLDQYPELDSVAVVPLGISKFNGEAAMRFHTLVEARSVVDTVADWQDIFETTLGKRMVYAADEYYLMAQRPFPEAERYDGFPMHEDGIGMARNVRVGVLRSGRRGHRRPAGLLCGGRRSAEPRCVHRSPPERVRLSAGRRSHRRIDCGRAAVAPEPFCTGWRAHRHARRTGDLAVDRNARSHRHSRVAGRESVLRRQYRGHRPHDRR